MKTRQSSNTDHHGINIKKYLFNLCLFVVLPSAAISTAVVLFSYASSTGALKQFVCKDAFIGDKFCHDSYNVAACQFDLGDCCLANPDSKQFCKYCVCYHDLGETTSDTSISWIFTANQQCPSPQFVGDGFCDDNLNNELCGYDGGDCCLNFIFLLFCSICECHIDKDKFQSIEICGPVAKLGDLICNDDTNIHTCNYDGGDCCLEYVNRDNCQICICHEDLKQHTEVVCPNEDFAGDLICDVDNNITSCNFDGGDCIEISPPRNPITHTTKMYVEIQTDAPILSAFESLCKYPSGIGDGFCYDENNIEVCDFDGGDCCQPNVFSLNCKFCICHITNSSSFVTWVMSNVCGGHDFIDGVCDDGINIAECGFDNGDCCSKSHGVFSSCDQCLCHTDYPECWFFSWIKDGVCDDEANNEKCGFDGGDCCTALIDDTFCKDCICHEDNLLHPAFDIPPCRIPIMVNNGFCNDETNTESCMYDGGECCKNIINDFACKVCLCHIDLERHLGYSEVENFCNKMGIGDGLCHDVNNKNGCAFDGGDCCLPKIDSSNCNVCICKADNTKHPVIIK